jgi:hypothetical protein
MRRRTTRGIYRTPKEALKSDFRDLVSRAKFSRARLKNYDLVEFFEFAHLCGDGSLAGIELLPL